MQYLIPDFKAEAKNDQEWSVTIRERDGICCFCGAGTEVQACHVVGRSVIKMRLKLINGVSLCAECHWAATNSAEKEVMIMRKALKNLYGDEKIFDRLRDMAYQ